MYQILFKELKIQRREDKKVPFGHEIKILVEGRWT